MPGLLIGLCSGAVFGWLGGITKPSYAPIEEAKLCYLALTNSSATLQPQTREYLKARLYSNAVLRIHPDWLEGWQIDFGPVDETALAGLDPIKDASTPKEVYEAALRRHPRAASKQ